MIKFPVLQYLNQLFFDNGRALVLSPKAYWKIHCVLQCERCYQSQPLERSWRLDYSDFIIRNWAIADRHLLEEESGDFLEHCWRLNFKEHSLHGHFEEPPSDSFENDV